MSKRHQKSHRKSQFGQWAAQPRVASPDLHASLIEAANLIERGRPQEAVDLLEPLSRKHPRVAPLHETLAVAHVALGDFWGGLDGFERAFDLARDERIWEPLARLYLQLEMRAHALHAFRQLRHSVPQDETSAESPRIGINEMLNFLEQQVQEMADSLRIPASLAEQGLRELENANKALHRGDYSACARFNRRAIDLLGDWPPPHNNLSLALFFSGSPGEAIATARKVLERDPVNIQALSNLCRFLAWTGEAEQARSYWMQLKALTPADPNGRLKMAEAAAILEDDQAVYDLLQPLTEPESGEEVAPPFLPHAQFLLAVAEANLGKPGAGRRLESVKGRFPDAVPMLQALKAGRPGPGLASRFPYFSMSELLPTQHMRELVDLMTRKDKIAGRRFRSLMDRFLARFPQTVLVAEKMLWEGEQPEAGMMLLEALGSPSAYAALWRFGLSQAGEDSLRFEALQHLARAGLIAPSDTLHVWAQGQWRDVHLREYKISEQEEPKRDPQVADLMQRGEKALQDGDDTQAERLFRRAIERDPQIKEAFNNLGAIYARRGDHAQAKQMFHAALELDPNYVFPLCNLAAYLLDDGDLGGAEAMLRSVADRAHFRPYEMAYYSYLQARLYAAKKNYDAAQNALQWALEIVPDYEPAQNMLQRLALPDHQSAFGPFMEQMRKRAQARRRRLQSKLTSREPRLAGALTLYSREVLTVMGRLASPHKSWSGMRKAQLLSDLVEAFQRPETIDHLVDGLAEAERAALRRVLTEGGQMPWADFDAQFGNDLDESPYWQWHEPATTMGRLRQRGLLVEATVDGEPLVAIPKELRRPLAAKLGCSD